MEEALFQAAIGLAPGERPAFLDRACGGDSLLRTRLELLLAAHDQPDTLRCSEVGPERASEAVADAVGLTFGRYRLVERLGEGGCGVVYVAEQTEPVRRRVALKLIKPGMDSKSVIARFEAERQALAMMDHPNIARVLDAGTTESGRPYFVMELVKGRRITEYGERNQSSTRERLEMFIKVCQAIQHAHQKGIIHRDIKPSNVLVTLLDGVGIPKVIDFGIAKAVEGRLTDVTMYTPLHPFLGTPAYMSPEQAEMGGLDIDTRTDIYSLGVLLYEVLTGVTPFDGKELVSSGLDAMRRTIREQEPVRPSTRLTQLHHVGPGPSFPLRPSPLPSDLDWIVMKCLEKDRNRRYATANGLAADLRRYLDHEPVVARPPSVAYRFRKALGRNKLVFGSSLAVALALLLATVISERNAQRALVAERLARRAAYAAEMNLAFQSMDEFGLGSARERLNAQRPKPGQEDLRGFEWRHLWHLCRGDERAVLADGFAGPVAWSPDGRFIASGSDELVVRDGGTRAVIVRGFEGARTLDFSPDSSVLAIGRTAGVELRRTDTWETLQVLPDSREPARFSRDGRWLVGGIRDGYRVWDAHSWKPLGDCPGAPEVSSLAYNAVAFSPDGHFLVTVAGRSWPGGDHFRVWRLPELDRLADLRPPEGEPGAAAFTADGCHLVTGLWDGRLLVWDVSNGRIVATLVAHRTSILAVAVAPDGRTFATAGTDRTIAIWDAERFRVKARLCGYSGEIDALAYSPDGRELVSAGNDGATRIWSAESDALTSTLAGPGLVAGFTADSRRLAVFRPDRICLWEPGTGTRITHPIPPDSMPLAHVIWGRPAAVHPSSPVAVRGGPDGRVEAWDLSGGRLAASWTAHDATVTAVAFSRDGTRLATGSSQGEVALWDFASRRELLRLDPAGSVASIRRPEHAEFASYVYELAFVPDGSAVAVARRNTGVWLLRIDSGQSIQLAPLLPEVSAVAVSPDGKTLAATSLDTVRLWDLESLACVATLRGHGSSARSLAFSPDGRTLASAGFDRRLILWSLTTLRQVASFPVAAPLPVLDFSPDGRMLAVSDLTSVGRGVHLLFAPTFDDIAAIEQPSSRTIGGSDPSATSLP